MSPAVSGALIAAAATGAAVIALGLGLEWWREYARQRALKKQLAVLAKTDLPESTAAILLRAEVPPEPGWIQFFVDRLSRLQNVQRLLRQAGLNWSMRKFLAYSVLSGLFFGLALNWTSQSLRVTLAGAVLTALVPRFYVGFRKRQLIAQFEQQFPEAIDLLARALRAGHPLSSGFKVVADESPEPLAGEFRRIFEEQRFGISLEESLNSLIDRVDLLDVRMLVTAVSIQREVGGNLAEILDGLGGTIRERFLIVGKLRGYTAQARLSGYVLAALPLTVGGMLFLINPAYILVLFEEPLGKMMLFMAVTMQVLGYLWIRAIVAVKY